MAKKATKRNPQDATLRNNQARKAEIAVLHRLLQAQADDLIVLRDRVETCERSVGKLESRMTHVEYNAAVEPK